MALPWKLGQTSGIIYSEPQPGVTAEELEIVRRGNEYEVLRAERGFKRLMAHLHDEALARLRELEVDQRMDSEVTLRLVDRWRATERAYQEIQAEIHGAIEARDELQQSWKVGAYGRGPEGSPGNY